MKDRRLKAPAVARNREPILMVLRSILPERGLVLEVASGSGEHVVYFASQFAKLEFLPSDVDAQARRSVEAWIAESGATNIRAPIPLDATQAQWSTPQVDAVLCINMVHISPWSATEGVIAGAARVLNPGAPLFLYGPYKRNGSHTSDSNREFDAWLRSENAEWGVRDLEAVANCARSHGFVDPQVVEMPANNLGLIFRRPNG